MTDKRATTPEKLISLAHGSGGAEMNQLIRTLSQDFSYQGLWQNQNDDAASYPLGDLQLVFTTDSYTVSPIFFSGGNIGKLAFCGTVNDLAMMGAKAKALSLAYIIEEGFPYQDLLTINKTIAKLSQIHQIPIVTGDTKVMSKGQVDKIVITTSGLALTQSLLNKNIAIGDKIIISGSLGDHGAALLAKRFDFETNLKSDSQPLYQEILAIKKLIKQARDITRGGLASILHELSAKNNLGFFIEENNIPIKKQVQKIVEILGIDHFTLACEGRFVCICDPHLAPKVLRILQKFNHEAQIIGEVIKEKKVILKTKYATRSLELPTGNIVPRIC